MIRREEARLRTAFRRLLLLGLAAPVAAHAACSSSSGSAASDAGSPDASMSDGSSLADGGPADDAITLGDSASVTIDWCPLGAPVYWDAGGVCDFWVRSPCGLPDGAVPLNCGGLVQPLCAAICDGGAPYGCQIAGYCSPDGAATYSGEGGLPGQDDSGALIIECLHCNGGRRPAGLRSVRFGRARTQAGDFFARLAHLESASIAAFHVLRDDLAHHGAPIGLVRAAERSARDEARHARIASRLSRARGGAPRRPRVKRARARSLLDVAIENAVEGCVRETYGACVAVWQAEHALDADVAAAMARIAADETRHAALAWAVARWASSRLDEGARARVERARRTAIEELRAEASVEPPAALVRSAGVPTAAQARVLVDRLARDLWG